MLKKGTRGTSLVAPAASRPEAAAPESRNRGVAVPWPYRVPANRAACQQPVGPTQLGAALHRSAHTPGYY